MIFLILITRVTNQISSILQNSVKGVDVHGRLGNSVVDGVVTFHSFI